MAVTTIRDVVAEGIQHAAKVRRRTATRRKLRRQRNLANATDAPEFIYHGGGRKVVDYTGDELHAEAPTASVFGIIIDTFKFWAKNTSDGDNNDEDDDLYAETERRHNGDELVLPEDQHLLMPRAVDPVLDAEYRREVERHDRRDRTM